MLTIPKIVSFNSIEEALLSIESAKSQQIIMLPSSAKFLGGLSETALIQLVATWAQNQDTANLYLSGDPKSEDFYDRLSGRLFGLASCLLSDDIFSKTASEKITDQIMFSCLKRLEKLQGNDPYSSTRGQATEILAVDHINRGKPLFLYNSLSNGGAIRRRDEYVRMASYLIRTSLSSFAYKKIDSEVKNILGNILYELFKNTHDHALLDSDKHYLSKSVRLIKCSVRSLNLKILDGIKDSFIPFHSYLSRYIPNKGNKNSYFLDLDILDTGPGFAQSWTGKPLSDMSLEQEYEATVECFYSGTSKNHDRFGKGLPLVIELITKKNGFLRLRTGRHSLYYDPENDLSNNSGVIPFKSFIPDDLSKLAPTSGTLVSISLPLTAKS